MLKVLSTDLDYQKDKESRFDKPSDGRKWLGVAGKADPKPFMRPISAPLVFQAGKFVVTEDLRQTSLLEVGDLVDD